MKPPTTTFPSRTFPAQKAIFFEGQNSDSAYLIKSGRVEISRKNGNQKIILDILTAPEIFGEMAFINNEPRSASALALDDCELIIIQRDHLENYLAQSPVVIRALIRCLSQRLKTTSSFVQTHGSSNMLSKICYVLSLMEPSYPNNSTPSKLELTIPHEKALKHLSKSLNIDVQHTKHIVNQLADLRLFKIEQIDNEKYIIINDKTSFLGQARALSSNLVDNRNEQDNQEEYITISQLAKVLETEPADIRARLSNGVIPDALIYFYKPDLFRWIDEL
jgi:CRP-like cAMP-binding protein